MSSLHSREGADDSHGKLNIRLFYSKQCYFSRYMYMSEKIWDKFPYGLIHSFEHLLVFFSSDVYFLTEQLKRDSYNSFVTSTGYSSTIHTYTYLHIFVQNNIRLIWLTSSIVTPDALFALLSLYISYASYSTLHLLIIQMIFFFFFVDH
jgi:hypothetical protein